MNRVPPHQKKDIVSHAHPSPPLKTAQKDINLQSYYKLTQYTP